MNKIYATLVLVLLLFVQTNSIVGKEKVSTALNKVDILNVGSVAYPSNLEERSDIPFETLVDEEFRKLIGDTVNYEKFRPTLIFFEKGFTAPNLLEKKVSFGYISITALSGKYRFPKEMSEVQKNKIENNIKHDVDTNLVGTQFKVKKWNPFRFKYINGLTAIQYSYEQTLKGKDQTNIMTTNLYDSDLQLQIVLSAPKKEYKKWLKYYNQILETFNRKVNIADIATFEYPTDIQEDKNIPFKYLVDKEFKKVLGDSVDYNQFRPGLLFLDRDFAITDTANISPFGNISFNILPEFNKRNLSVDSMKVDVLEANIRNNIQKNIDSTDYKITKWGDFKIKELRGIPALQYSYEQQLRDEEASEIHATYLFDKLAQIQINMSSPLSTLSDWKSYYDNILNSYQRLLKVSDVGTMVYPINVEERNDIPFEMLVDKESKRKLGDSIDYERFRPSLVLLKNGFNENDSTQLENFSSITINVKSGDFSKMSDPDSISVNSIQEQFRASVERNLKNTNYTLNSWDSFDSYEKHGYRIISYSYTQQLDDAEPKHISITYFYTATMEAQVTLTASESEYSLWEPEYNQMIESFRLSSWR